MPALRMSSAKTNMPMPKGSGEKPRTRTERTGKAGGPQVLTFALQHRPRATRASVPKVRSGCITCKRRHVKCDEAKPSCQRCMKWQGFCDGYGMHDSASPSQSSGDGSRSSSSASPPADTKQLPPTVTSTELTRARKPPILPEPDFNSSVFTYQWDKVYFDHWLSLAHNIGGGWFETNLFTHTIPQLSRDEPAVRYASMAIGALANAIAPNVLANKALASIPATAPTTTADSLSSAHYKQALTYYGRALRLVRLQQNPLGSDTTLRAAVISCLLFACFETLHGNRDVAVSHINHGLAIMDQFMSAHRSNYRTLKTDDPDDKLVKPEPTNAPLSGYVEYGERSPAPFVLEDEILQVFQRLDYQSWSTGVMHRWRDSPPIYIRANGNHSQHDVPGTFSDLKEARRWWDLVQHWALHLPRAVVEKFSAMTAPLSGGFNPDMTTNLDFCDVPEISDMQCQTIEMLEQWHRAFMPLCTASRANKWADPKPYFQAASMLMQYHLSWICIRTACFSNYAALHEVTPRFREVVKLAATLLPNQPKVSGEIFTMDNGPTLALFMAATKCRDRNVRADATALLRRYPRKDAFWDSRAAARIAETNMGIEDENEKYGNLAEQWWRLRRREGIMADRKPECRLKYYVRNAATGQWEYTSEVVQW
ncbi:hypothetical protein QBC46DRAFT_128133 [Diplogelasinospora grovesii]|uniref:Zn(2)-C6 fungal-type domain-containing protein n=1 Tax=Diplogelasinospora grovesii TaxID=303347 RepID=A0AAN6S407_9PEZI|nr:hypothetical protein QBC46DRAFT_128133 [Diplogelasinospora grovesii]